ncbi:MAG: hypothetical protein ACRD88_21660 [Terriglobia bacterium]
MTKNFGVLSLLIAMSLWACGVAQAQVGRIGASGSRPAAPLARDSQPAPQPAGTLPELDLRSLRVQLEAFQDIVNRSVAQSFEHPFTLLQDAKGIYLPRFGVVFHMEVNLHPLRLISPFDMRPYTPEELRSARATKLARIRELKARLSALLLEHGTKLTEVPPDQSVAIAVHLFNLPSEQSEGLPTQVVLEATRGALLEAQARRMPIEEFQKQQVFLEF